MMEQRQGTEFDRELLRIEAEYKRRNSTKVYTHLYSYFNEANLLQTQSLERNILALFKKHSFINLNEKKILDVGCGKGSQLQRFMSYGALPSNLYGIDLMEDRIEYARQLYPAIEWRVGSAHQLPYSDATFDLVISSVVFSSLLSESLQQQIADEMWRVRKPGGWLLFYDFMYSNPRNSAVRGITVRRVKNLFGLQHPGARFDFRHITLAPQLSRKVAPHAFWLAEILEQLKFLNTHILGLIS